MGLKVNCNNDGPTPTDPVHEQVAVLARDLDDRMLDPVEEYEHRFSIAFLRPVTAVEAKD